jgi:two-component system, NarL family, response regulator FusR
MRGKSSLLLVDDHAVVREGLRELFSREADLEVVGEARDPEEAMQQAKALQPAAAIVDLSLGRDTGFGLIASLRAAHPNMAILVLSMHDERVFAQRALQSGANGYVGKHEDSQIIIGAVRRVLSGKTHVSESVNEMLLASLAGPATTKTRPPGLARLSDRELEILQLIGQGVRTSAIADQLDISVKTVETHRARIREKLGAESTTELMVLAVNWLRDGFLEARS